MVGNRIRTIAWIPLSRKELLRGAGIRSQIVAGARTPRIGARDMLWRRRGKREGVMEPAMSELNRITVDPGQCGGRPCLRGLRIRVKDVLDLLAAGASRDEILGDYPLLEAGDIAAALEYAARQSDHPVLRVA